MVKLSASRKKFILEVFAVLVVCAFLASSTSAYMGSSGMNPHVSAITKTSNVNLGNISKQLEFLNLTNVGASPSATSLGNNSMLQRIHGYKSSQYLNDINGTGIKTLFLNNNTVINSTSSWDAGWGPSGFIFDPFMPESIFVSNEYSDNIFQINDSSGNITKEINLPGEPITMAVNEYNGDIYVGMSNRPYIAVISFKNESLNLSGYMNITATSLSGDSLIFDSSNGYLYASGSRNTTVIDPSNGSIVKELFAGGYITYNQNNNFVYVTNTSYISEINASTNNIAKIVALNLGNATPSPSVTSAAFDPVNQNLYIANFPGTVEGGIISGSNITIFNTVSNKKIGVIDGILTPYYLLYDQDNKLLYVTSGYGNTVYAVNTTSQSIIGPIGNITFPSGIGIDPKSDHIFVGSNIYGDLQNVILVINGSTNLPIGTINVGILPISILYDSQDNLIYSVEQENHQISIINPQSNRIIKSFDFNAVGWGGGITFLDKSNGFIYLYSSSLFAINTSVDSVKQILGVSAGNSFQFNPLNKYIYLASIYYNKIYIVSTINNTLVKTINVTEPVDMTIGSDDNYLYIVGGENLTVLNMADNTIYKTIFLGHGMGTTVSVTFDNLSNNLYITSYGYNYVEVVNTSTFRFITNITVGFYPYSLVYDSTDNLVFVDYLYSMSWSTGGISIINPRDNQVIKALAIPDATAIYQFKLGYYLLVQSGNSFFIVNATVFNLSTELKAGNGPVGETYDPLSNSIYVANFWSGSITIMNLTKIVPVIMSYLVFFNESGLPSGTSWSITLNGTSESSTSSTITFSLPNGTYSYTVSSVSGYSVSSSSGSISVNGASVSKTVSFTPINKSTPPSGISSTELYGIIGVVAAIAVIGSVLAIMRRKR